MKDGRLHDHDALPAGICALWSNNRLQPTAIQPMLRSGFQARLTPGVRR